MVDANLSVLKSMQLPINLFDLGGLDLAGSAGERLVMANHPFGGSEGIDKGRALLESLSRDETIPAAIRRGSCTSTSTCLPTWFSTCSSAARA